MPLLKKEEALEMTPSYQGNMKDLEKNIGKNDQKIFVEALYV